MRRLVCPFVVRKQQSQCFSNGGTLVQSSYTFCLHCNLVTCSVIIIYHHQVIDCLAGAGTSSTSVGPPPGSWLAQRIADFIVLTADLQMFLNGFGNPLVTGDDD